MKRILVPIDGSPRSLLAIQEVKQSFSPKAFDIIVLMVQESAQYIGGRGSDPNVAAEFDKKLKLVSDYLDNYTVIKKTAIGKPGNRIVECAKEMGVSLIVMTRSTKANLSNSIGMTASYVLRHATCNILIVREKGHSNSLSYRGSVYNKAEGVVTLRGQLSSKQSECLLPSVRGNVIYHITVVRGCVRFVHRSYNASTGEWDEPPLNGQRETYEVMEGDTMSIPVNAENETGTIDKIRIVNKSMKTEAVFRYKITKEGKTNGKN